MSDLISIVEEPAAKTYLDLLGFAARTSSIFSLVWRDQLDFNVAAATLLEDLKPDLIAERRTDEWPGTRLLGHEATLRIFRLTAASFSVLADAGRLYAWEAASRPEDLAFWTAAEEPWLGSIAHEKDAFLYADRVEIGALRRAAPTLALGGR